MRKRGRVQLSFDTDGVTHQSFKDECDINNIIRKYKKTGMVSHITSRIAQNGDFTSVPDFHEAMNIVAKAQQDFDLLPALLRKRFQNDPAQFLDFVSDASNLDEMRTLGLLNPEVSAPNVAPLKGLDAHNTSPLGDSTSGST